MNPLTYLSDKLTSVFGGRLEKTQRKKDRGVSTVNNLINDLRTSREEAQEVIEEVDDEIETLENVRDDAVEVRRFVDSLSDQFGLEK